MGGGTKPEHLLVILPFAEPVGIFERIKKNHPDIKITYRNLHFVNFEDGVKEIPKGRNAYQCQIPSLLNITINNC